jgi:Na+-driven multidrug efflux pump
MLNLAMTAALIAAVAVLDRVVLGLFLGSDARSIDLAAHINLIGSASFLLFGVSMVLSATVRANGAVVGPLIILAIALFPIRLGLASVLQPSWGADAIWWSFPAGSAASMLMTIAYYQAGGWRKGRLMSQHHAEEKAIADGEPTAKQMPLG